jgi:hypothetical protein
MMDFVTWDDEIPNIWKKIFQTTNQIMKKTNGALRSILPEVSFPKITESGEEFRVNLNANPHPKKARNNNPNSSHP